MIWKKPAFPPAHPSGRHTSPATPTAAWTARKELLRAALLKCETLTEAEVNAYISYEFDEIETVDVPLDYALDHPDADIAYLFADGIPVSAFLLRHTAQIEAETLEKVQQVLQAISDRDPHQTPENCR